MDNLCHTLVGAAIGEAGLKTRAKYGNAVLIIAANLPDVDALAFVAETPAVALRRGWTHGVLAQALLPLILTGAVLAFDRVKAGGRGRSRPSDPAQPAGARGAPLLLLGYVGVISHVLLDWLNNYGIRLLKPFSDRWFYGDSVFIIDPWLWVLLGAGTMVARRRRSRRPARMALIAATAYIAIMVAIASFSRQHVLGTHPHLPDSPQALMVGPVPLDPLRKTVIVNDGRTYQAGRFDWWSGELTYHDTRPHLADHPAVLRARDDRRVRAVLVWARFPYYEVTRTEAGTVVTVSDMRFGFRVGSVSVVIRDP